MLERAEILNIIDEAYASRARGDLAGVARFLAPGAKFRIAGDHAALTSFSAVPGGAAGAEAAVAALMNTFDFLEHERVNVVVEGGKAAVHWRVLVQAGDKEPVPTELFDLWTFNDEGKIVSFLQFADTAMVARLMA